MLAAAEEVVEISTVEMELVVTEVQVEVAPAQDQTLDLLEVILEL
jgi:hypothetical protein